MQRVNFVLGWTTFSVLILSTVITLHTGKFCILFLLLSRFLQDKLLSGIRSECQIVWIKIRLNILSGLILAQTVCKDKVATSSIVKTKLYLFNPYKPSVLLLGHRQMVQNQIRCHRTLRLIRFSSICLQNILLKFE